jgi:hypothetical protein
MGLVSNFGFFGNCGNLANSWRASRESVLQFWQLPDFGNFGDCFRLPARQSGP